MIDVEKYLPFLKENDLHPPQFLYLLCLYMEKTKKNGLKYLKMYKEMFPADDPADIIHKVYYNDLITRGFIKVRKTDKRTISISDIEITDKFTNIFVDKFKAAEEFWEAYPPFLISNGKRLPLTYWNTDVMREEYHKRIKGSMVEHIEVMKDLKYAVENDLVGAKMETFVCSEQWKTIRKMRLEPNVSPVKESLEMDTDI